MVKEIIKRNVDFAPKYDPNLLIHKDADISTVYDAIQTNLSNYKSFFEDHTK